MQEFKKGSLLFFSGIWVGSESCLVKKPKFFFQVQIFLGTKIQIFGSNSKFFWYQNPNFWFKFQFFLGTKIQIFGPNSRIFLGAKIQIFGPNSRILFARILDREILRFAGFSELASRWIAQRVFRRSWKRRFGDRREKIRRSREVT